PVITLDVNFAGRTCRTPNKTGQGNIVFTAYANVTAKGRDYRASIYQTSRACNLQTVEVVLYHKGRATPENQLTELRAAIVAAYVEAFGLLPRDAALTP